MAARSSAGFGWTPAAPGGDHAGDGVPAKLMMSENRPKQTKSMKPAPPELFLDRLPTPIGVALLVTDGDGVLCALDWEDYEARMRQLLRLQHGVVALQEAAAPRDLTRALAAYFDGELASLSGIRWRVAGTPFQRKVWTALPNIPPGTTMSYGALAARLGSPRAMRAVGHANGANPISIVIPCHRLIGADGTLVKYGGGLARKRWLLAHEGADVVGV
jgi:methylated-DNA-[protein]-cysteine S-methyltransferase